MTEPSNVPIPDPSTLTRDALDREIRHLRELTSLALSEKDLRDNQRFEAQSKALDAARVAADLAVQAALVAAEKAVSKAELAADKRFDTLVDKIDDLKTFQATSLGRGIGVSVAWGVAVGVLGLAISVAILLAS